MADEQGALAVLFRQVAPGVGVTPDTRSMVLFSVAVPGVPPIHVEEALWTVWDTIGSIVVKRLLAALVLLLVVPATASAEQIAATAKTEVLARPAPRGAAAALRVRPGAHLARARTRSSSRATTSSRTCPAGSSASSRTSTYKDGDVPRVDVIHLHHGVWISNVAPLFAAGEEKTIVTAPQGFGWRYKPSDSWIMNHMIHNLTPSATDVYITYDLDFIPEGSPAAAGIQDVQDAVDGRHGDPGVPGVRRPQGRGRARQAVHLPGRVGPAAATTATRWTAQEDGVLVGTAATCTRAGCGPT